MSAVFIVLFIVIVVGLIAWSFIHRRNMSFEGTVVDKDIQEEAITNTNQPQQSGISFGNNTAVQHVYKIKVQTTAGKVISWQVSEGKYQIINIGDTVTKLSGTTDISVTPKAQAENQTPPAPTQIPPATPPPTIVSPN